jgi:hypothetical protein
MVTTGLAAIPLTKPEVEPIVANEGLLLVQLPPPASVNRVVKPTQTELDPLTGSGKGFMEIVLVIKQPVGIV